MDISNSCSCPDCQSGDIAVLKSYSTVHNGLRFLYRCGGCGTVFSETHGTPMQDIKTPISKVASALRIRSEGMGLNATARVLDCHKGTILEWENRFAEQKETLMLYAVCHKFISLTFEGDELYTVINKRKDPSDSEGWTAVIMDRASRFIIDQQCGSKNAELFESVMISVSQFVDKTDDLTFLSDGERRYGNTLFDLCAQVLRTGKRGRPPKVLPEGIKVRIKNKGDQKHKRGPKRPKYQVPHREHPDTEQNLSNSEIHANHLEGQNAATRRRNSAFRRRTNTYAKSREGLQRTLDVHLVIHNFVRPHWTTGEVPAVRLGIVTGALRLEDILTMKKAA